MTIRRQSFAARSLPAFFCLFTAVWLTHAPLLALPYYWDEAGYYIPAAWDFYHTGTLIPHSTLSNAHPPLPSLYLAAAWRLFGYAPWVTRSAVCLVAALALAAVYTLAVRLTGSRSQAAATTLLTSIYPVWFAQSTLAHADIFAAAATLWALIFYFQSAPGESPEAAPGRRRLLFAAVYFSLAALAKETAIGIPLTLALWELASARKPARAAVLALPVVPLALWFLYHRQVTGFFFGNPEFLRYNATATLTPVRVLIALANRTLHLTAHMNLFAATLPALACLLLPKLAGRAAIAPRDRNRVLLLVVSGLVFFSVLGGALLTRYLLPLYPLVLVLAVNIFATRLHRWPWLVASVAAAFAIGLFVNPPYQFAPEDNLDYRDVILLHQAAIREVEQGYGHPTILTAWPVADELTRPELGYVSEPYTVVPIDNFSLPQIQKAAATGTPYSVAILFSTKYTPVRVLIPLGRTYRQLDQQFFAAHSDLQPEQIARMLGGARVWREDRGGQWAAVVLFQRPELAVVSP